MRDLFLLSSDAILRLQLRTIDPSDCERLRQWKNANRRSFFFQEIIEPEEQRRWYEGYGDRPEDFMFVVEAAGDSIGCMGFRIREGEADVYNVIRGVPDAPGGLSGALRLMCSYAQAQFRCGVVARVLKSNPAVAWYEKNAFAIASEHDTHYLLRLERFTPLPFRRTETALPGAP